MEEKIILPQNTRLMGALLGFIGGGLDVFCHMHYRSLVATQTGNLLLLIADWHDPRVENTIMRFSSILFFSIGFVVALHIKEYRKTAFWRTKMLIPLFVVTLLIPLGVCHTTCRSSLYCFWDRDDDVDLYRKLD